VANRPAIRVAISLFMMILEVYWVIQLRLFS
jgi:hypothetical protein